MTCRQTARIFATALLLASVAGCGPKIKHRRGTTAGAEVEEGASNSEAVTLPFERNNATLRLLPFPIRLGKLASFAGKPATDPLFASLLEARFSLGAYEHATGIGQDITWSASKMEAWARQMIRLCATPAFHTRFAGESLDERLLALWRAAFGRDPTGDEREAIANLADTANLDEKTQFTAVCTAALSSTEFVTHNSVAAAAGDGDIASADAAERYLGRLAPIFVQRTLTQKERRAIQSDGFDAVEATLAKWAEEPAFADSFKVLVQTLLGLSGRNAEVDHELVGDLALHVASAKRPIAELITSSDCYDPKGGKRECDTGAPFAAGILTTRAFQSNNANRFNLHRANVMLNVFACKHYPIDSAIEKRVQIEHLIPMFGVTGDDEDMAELEFGNGARCHSCHGQFALHTQLFVKFDAAGLWQSDATGVQDESLEAGLSAGGQLFTSHFKDPKRSGLERSTIFGKQVGDLGEAAQVLATRPEFLQCMSRHIINFAFGLDGGKRQAVADDFLAALVDAVRQKSKTPSYKDLVIAALAQPEVVKAAMGIDPETQLAGSSDKGEAP